MTEPAMKDGKVRAHYSCDECQTKVDEILVEERINGTEFMPWVMQVLYPTCRRDHDERSPACKSQFLNVGIYPNDA